MLDLMESIRVVGDLAMTNKNTKLKRKHATEIGAQHNTGTYSWNPLAYMAFFVIRRRFPCRQGRSNPGYRTTGAVTPTSDGSLQQNGTRTPGNEQPTKTTETGSDAKIDAEKRKLEGKVKSTCKGC
jgi:hypothetical protein